MKIDFSQPIKNLAGNAYKVDDKDLTLGAVASEALLQSKSGGKLKMFSLAQKIFEGGEVDIDVADVQLIKQSLETTEAYGGNTVIVGRSLELLS